MQTRTDADTNRISIKSDTYPSPSVGGTYLINKQIREYNSILTNKMKLMKNSDPKSYWSILHKYSSEGKKALQKVSVESFYDHFSKLNEATPENDFDDIDPNNLSEFNTELNSPVTDEEIF